MIRRKEEYITPITKNDNINYDITKPYLGYLCIFLFAWSCNMKMKKHNKYPFLIKSWSLIYLDNKINVQKNKDDNKIHILHEKSYGENENALTLMLTNIKQECTHNNNGLLSNE